MDTSSSEESKLPFGLSTWSAIALLILCILYGVGLIGLSRPDTAASILPLTALNLLLSFIIVLLSDPKKGIKLWIAMAIIMLAGFGIEVIGVATGYIFGTYSYGSVLGYRWQGTPLMIGVNWAMLCYCTFCTIDLFFAHWRKVSKALYGAVTLVFLDVVLEPIAMRLNFWSWPNDLVPMQNYVAWGLISFGFLFFLFSFLESRTNKVAYGLLILQFVFFGGLSLTLLN